MEFEEELEKIRKLFPSVRHMDVRGKLLEYMSFPPAVRIKSTVRDLLSVPLQYPADKLADDVEYIRRLFPERTERFIRDELIDKVFVKNSVEIVVRNLLKFEEFVEIMGEMPELPDVKYTAYHTEPAHKKLCLVNDVNGNVDLNLPSTSGSRRKSKAPSTRRSLKPVSPLMPIATIKVDSDDENDNTNQIITPEGEAGDENIDKRLLYHIMEMFPLADTNFLRSMVRHRIFNEENITEVIDAIFNIPNYPKRAPASPECREDEKIVKEEKLETLRELLPDADPHFLEESLQDIETEKGFQEFVSKCLQDRHYPTYTEFIENSKLSTQAKQYTTEFSVHKFVELHPNPVEFFESDKCKAMVLTTDEEMRYANSFFRNMYPKIGVNQIHASLQKKHLLQVANELNNTTKGFLRSKRKIIYHLGDIKNIPLLQAFAYIKHKELIMDHLKLQKRSLEEERAMAKCLGQMKTCRCCYDEEVLLREIVTCDDGCEFCRECLESSVKIQFSEGRHEYACLLNCGAQFKLATIQKVLKPKLFSKLVQKKQLQEIKAAGIEDIEYCPFCDFATIMTPEDRLFVCLNRDCMKESCRLCKEPSHIPLRCEEVEKDDDIKRRVYIENKMTEALIRKCPKCGMNFIKSDGCNKMTCSCGAMMCYVCSQPVTDYKHFNGQGGTNYKLCPLYSDTNKLHMLAVMNGANEAKRDLRGEELKVDPTKGIKEYYAELHKKNPTNLPPGY